MPEIAWAPASCREPPERAANVGHAAQRPAQGLAQPRILGEQRDQIEPRLDPAAVHQRRADIGRQQSRARRRHRAVDRVEQAALARAVGGLREFEAFARRRVDRHLLRGLGEAWGAQEGDRALGGMVEIGDETACRSERRAPELAEAVERGDVVQRLEPRLPPSAVEIGAGAQHRRRFAKRRRFGRDRLGRREPCEFGTKARRIALDQLETPGRDVGGGDRDAARRFADRDAPVRGARIEQRLLGQRPRRHHADDRARDERLAAALLGVSRALGLLGDRDAVAGLDQPREIGVGGMDRHAAHRDRHPVMLAARGERDVEYRGGDLRIVEEHLEEIAHPVE